MAGQTASSEQVARAKQELQAAVREQWRNEAQARSLGDPDPMPVRWRLSDPAVMDHDKHIASTPLRFAGRSDQITALTDQFRRLRRRRLVIIGGPGSGKTTLAVQLVLQLLEGWQRGEPVPVLFSLASWDPQTQPRVQDWLAGQLTQTYPDLRAFGTDTVQRLADQGRLLPVLDGLDEIAAERRGKVIERLNASLHPDTGLIVTSRTAEYRDTVGASDVLTAAAVIEPEPMTPDQAAMYLKDLLPRQPDESWQAVLTALVDGTAGALGEVVSSPLGLWLLHVVHIDGNRDPQPLIDPSHYPDPAAIQDHLLEELIPAAVRSRPPLASGEDPLRPHRRHDPEQARRWLTTLAIELRDAQTHDWRWWQLAHHTLTREQFELAYGRWGGLMFSLWFQLAPWFGVFYHDVPVHADFRLRGRAMALGSTLTSDQLVKLLSLLIWMALWGLLWGLTFGLVGGAIGLAWGLAGALAFRRLTLLSSPSIARRASSPAESQRGDKQLTILATSIFVLVYGSVTVLCFWPIDKLSLFPTILLVLTLINIPTLPLHVIKACWPAFVVASLWLGMRRRLPLRLMRFLDDAYRLGLLRVVGPVYQFRHASLQDHLAPRPSASAT